jgi:transcriptional regulator with PAS, ATPase and Fis domain
MKDIVADGLLSNSITQRIIESKMEVIEDQRTYHNTRHILTGRPIKDKNGNVIMVLTIVRDMNTIDALQKALMQVRKKAQEYRLQLQKNKNMHQRKYVAKNPEFLNVLSLAKRVSRLDSTVLICGESGTGKEIIAREIHENSERSAKPFLKINCSAIPEQLLESELFGYEKWGFTGASPNGHTGIFEAANKGTLLLDEIGDLPLSLQVKLLRVLQERKIKKIGDNSEISVDNRIIASTNANLEQMVKDNKFRSDLFYRLNVVRLNIPPLRSRKDEIPALIAFFVDQFNQRYMFNKRIMPDLIRKFMSYDWPGNVRELENTIERMVVTSEKDDICSETMHAHLNNDVSIAIDEQFIISGMMPLEPAIDRLEEYLVSQAAQKYGSSYRVAAALQISQASAFRKMQKLKSKIKGSSSV